MGKMHVNRSDDLAGFVAETTRNDGDTTQSEVVFEGLRPLRARNRKGAALLTALEQGHADTLTGRVRPLTDKVLRDIARRGRRLAQQRADENR